MNENVLLSVTNLKVKFDGRVILNNIDFNVAKNEAVAIIGPNGAGKSVLFRAILGLIPYEGKVEWKEGIKIGYVPQKLSVAKDFPLTTSEFLSLKEKDKEKVLKVIGEVGFEKDGLKKRIGVLSGGEFQRVLIAFALLGSPNVLLFDEPTAGVDLSSEETIYSLLHRLQEKKALTVILISHELGIIYKYANTVVCLNKERVCFGPPREVLDRENLAKLYGEEIGVYQHH